MKISIGSLLFHAVHGMCRVREIMSDNSGDSYGLVPSTPSRNAYRYVIHRQHLGESGFHEPISASGAQDILDYFRTGRKAGNVPAGEPAEFSTWSVAESVMTCARDENQLKDLRKRSALNRNAYALVREFSCVLKITLTETVSLIHKSLRGSGAALNPAILNALEKALSD